MAVEKAEWRETEEKASQFIGFWYMLRTRELGSLVPMYDMLACRERMME